MGPEPVPVAPLDALKSALQAAPRLRERMGRDIQPNRRLCELLGYDDQPARDGTPGRDPTQGYCGALPDADLSRLAFARPLGQITASGPTPPAAAPQPPKAPATSPAPAPAAVRPAMAARPAPGPRVAMPPPGRTVARPAGAATITAEMIPPGARYVRIGRFPDAQGAAQAARRVAALGYPVLRDKGQGNGPGQGDSLLSGPFDSREAIVRALNRLRAAGFAGAVAR